MFPKKYWRQLLNSGERIRALYDEAARIKRTCGINIATQFYEIWRLSCSETQMTRAEYYEYCLYDNSRFTWAEKQKFLGRKMENYFVSILGMNALEYVGS